MIFMILSINNLALVIIATEFSYIAVKRAVDLAVAAFESDDLIKANFYHDALNVSGSLNRFPRIVQIAQLFRTTQI